MSTSPRDLLPAVRGWLENERRVQSTVLFGSSARRVEGSAPAGSRADLDLHVITTTPVELEHLDWSRALPDQRFCHRAVRSATGGVRKVTVLFATGEIDLVLVPAARFRLARLAFGFGLQRRWPALRVALNEVATCLHSGYRFLKGEKEWGAFYTRVAADLPGVRLADAAVRNLADIFLCDLRWIFQKLESGELSAAQHLLHRSLAELNFRLVRELRLRRGQPVLSFGLGRRVETILDPAELAWVQVDAPLRREELRRAAWTAFQGLQALMGQLVPGWQVPAAMRELLAPFSPPPR